MTSVRLGSLALAGLAVIALAMVAASVDTVSTAPTVTTEETPVESTPAPSQPGDVGAGTPDGTASATQVPAVDEETAAASSSGDGPPLRQVAAGLALVVLGGLVVLYELTSGEATSPGPESDDPPPEPTPPDADSVTLAADVAPTNDVYRAWSALQSAVAAADDSSGPAGTAPATPAGVRDRAVAAGLPPEPVTDLTELFCAVRGRGRDAGARETGTNNRGDAGTGPGRGGRDMTDRRRLPTVVGMVAVAAGGLLLAVPELGSGLVPRVGATLLTVGVGAAAVVLAARQVFDSDDAPIQLPTPESRPGYQTPGASFAARLDAVSTVGRRAVDDDDDWDGTDDVTPREWVHASLHDLAVAVLGRTHGDTPGAAADRLAGGDWTDDESAGAFFAGGLRPPLPRRASLPGFQTDLPVVRRARHAVVELARKMGASAPDPDSRLAAGPVREDSDAAGEYWPTADLPQTRSTGRTRRVAVAVLLASAGGVVMGVPGTVLTATFGIALAGAARVWEPTADIELTRRLETATPAPGSSVEVTVTVRNAGERTVPDLRLLDGVPAGLAVSSGSPRVTTALRPGTERSFTYTVEAVPGVHRFESPIAIVGDVAGARETVRTVAVVEGAESIECGFKRKDSGGSRPREQATQVPGRHDAGVSGSGVEFDALREYRPGDPPASIDWHHRAKTGDLATVAFREPRQPRVALIVDTRPAAYVAATPGGVPAPRHAARAAHTLAEQLLDNGVPVGFGTVGPDDWWLPPAAGADHCEDIRTALTGESAVPWSPPEQATPVSTAVENLTARLDPDVQVLLVSPLCDDDGEQVARRLEAAGHAVSVVSPDITSTSTIGGAYAWLAREDRLSALRGHDIPVCDWDPATPLREVRARATTV